MESGPCTSSREHVGSLTDPRVERTKEHRPVDIVTIARCAVRCGADDGVSVETSGRAKEGGLRTSPALPGGIPSRDTFGRVFARLAPDECRAGSPAWVRAVTGPELADGVVAIDGETARRSHERGTGEAALHLVSAWATASGPVLGQVATDDQSNEIAAIPALLRLLALEGCAVTIDALGCRTAIAARIVEQGADYVPALNDDRPPPHERARLAFADARAAAGTPRAPADLDTDRTVDKGHGRLEIRRRRATGAPEYPRYLDPDGAGPDLRSRAPVEAERRIGDAVTTELRYYPSSLPPDAAALGRAVRRHREVEDRPHRALDVAFREDDGRARTGHAPENLAISRHLALDLLRRDSAEGRPATTRFRAALDDRYLPSLLAQLTP